VPLNLWLRRGGAARDFIGDLLGSDRAKTRPYLKPGFSVDKALNGQSAYGRNLWALISLELWFRQFIDGPAADSVN
jgi:asparagine synthase (glutamine-hydrolysing)